MSEESKRESEVRRAVAIVSVVMVVSVMSGVTLVRTEAQSAGAGGHSFIGTAPEASAIAEIPPTF